MNTTTTRWDSDIAWLRGPAFDITFVFGVAAIAIASGALVFWNNELFIPVLVADLWILGYHHVIATYTRLAFDRKSFAENKVLIFYLLPAVAAAVAIMVAVAGLWLIPTVYLYWQWWHYTRQSEGISKAYAGRAREKQIGDPRIARAALYALPLAGILTVSSRSPDEFLFFPLKTIPVADTVLTMSYIVAGALFALWVLEQFRAWRSGKIAIAYCLYVFSHFLIYYVAYIHFDEINYGWLVINVWHNAQYIGFVWLYNNRRFGGKIDPESVFLSTISQNRRFLLYFATCLTISTVIYYLVFNFLADALGSSLALTTTAVALIIYQTINFHHYIVDSLIWKLRKKPISKTLGIS
jgi:hypothetical protein